MKRSSLLIVAGLLASPLFCQPQPAGKTTLQGMNLPPVSAYLDENDDTVTRAQFVKIINQGYYEMQIMQKEHGIVDLRLTPKPLLTLVNNPIPDFEFTDMDGKHWSNRTISGHMAVLHFWSMKNKSCLEEIVWMNAMKKANPEMIWLAPAYETIEKVRQFLTTRKFEMTVIPGQKDLMDEFFIEKFPSDIIIDKTGIVREIVVGKDPEKIISFLEENPGLK